MRCTAMLLMLALSPATALAASTIFEAELLPASPMAGEAVSLRVSNRPESGCHRPIEFGAPRAEGSVFVVEVDRGDTCHIDGEVAPVTFPLGLWPAGIGTVHVVETAFGPDGVTVVDTILLRPVDTTLAVRQRSFRRFEAVVTGVIGDECGPYVVAPLSVTRQAQQIRLSTPAIAWGACVQPSDRAYTVVVPLGDLPAGEHEVLWQQEGFFDVSVRFEVSPDAVFFEGFE